MRQARSRMIQETQDKIVINTGSDQTAMESIISAQQGLRNVHEIMKQTNIALLKIWSIMVSKAPKHANTVTIVMICAAILLSLIPFKFMLMSLVLYGSVMTTSLMNEQSNK